MSGREGEEEEPWRGGVGWEGCRPPRRRVARLQGGRLAGLGRARGLHRAVGPAGAAVAGGWREMGLGALPTHLGAAKQEEQTRRRGADLRAAAANARVQVQATPGPLRRATAAAEGGGRAGAGPGAARRGGACPRRAQGEQALVPVLRRATELDPGRAVPWARGCLAAS